MSSSNKKGKIPVEIITAPEEAQIQLNDRAAGNKLSLAPGHYTLKVSYQNFNTYTSSFDVVAGSSGLTFPVELAPQNGNGSKLVDAERKQFLKVEGIAGQKVQESNDAFIQNNGIVRFVPYKTSFYSIDYAKDEQGKLFLQVTASTPVGRQVALQQIRSWGFDPTDYRIDFIGLANPFKTGGTR
jgi:hypothetical protein